MGKVDQIIIKISVLLVIAVSLAAVCSALTSPPIEASAEFIPTSRVYLRTSTRVYHHWVLSLPDSKTIECHIYTVDHEQPGHEDVLGFCGTEVYLIWVDRGICLMNSSEAAECPGLLLDDIGEIDQRLKTTIWLPGAEVSIQLRKCSPWEDCDKVPELYASGYEPLQNEHIESVHIEFANAAGTVCRNSSVCRADFPQTGEDGMDVSVYVTSSYGDDSAPYTFRVRILPQVDGSLLFQALYTSWDYLAPPESVAWGIFPQLGSDIEPWLIHTNDPADLATSHDYALLAGRYILRGDVDISRCVYGGLTNSGGATQCGMEQAREIVYQAQNDYDDLIITAAQSSRIPPRIIKGVIAQESQFWPEWYLNGEFGLGMLTDEGIEMMLIWNPVAFLDLCVPEYGAADCAWGYDSLGDYPQDYIRGLALGAIGTDREVELIAQTIVGAAAQAGQIVKNVTGKLPYQVMGYEDMWKVSLGVYNSGAGCMFYAIDEAWDRSSRLSWGMISEYLLGDCQGASDYPNSVLFNGVP